MKSVYCATFLLLASRVALAQFGNLGDRVRDAGVNRANQKIDQGINKAYDKAEDDIRNAFGNQYSERGKTDKELSSLQLLVDDYDAAKRGTEQFYLKVAFGKTLVGNKYEISGSTNSMAGAKQGKGRLTLTENGGKKPQSSKAKPGPASR